DRSSTMASIRTLALLLATAAPLCAQDERAALRIQTTDPDMAAAVCARYAPNQELPQLGRGAFWDLRLASEFRLAVTTGTGLVGETQIIVNPRVMVKHLADQIAAARALAESYAIPALERCGIGTDEAREVVATLFAQIDTLDNVRVNIS